MATFRGWTEKEIRLAVERAGKHFHDNLCLAEMPEAKGRGFKARIRVKSGARLKKKDLKTYAKLIDRVFKNRLIPDHLYPPGASVNWSGPRSKGAAACWHAYGRFFRELFKINPDGVIKTMLADYIGEDGFEDNYPQTADDRVGSRAEPRYRGDACCCDRYEIGDF
jgi:hypothetical protein